MKTTKALCLLFFLFFSASVMAQVTAWRDLYKVKKKDSLYGIAQMYGLTIEELKAANPEMAADGYVLKKGDTVFIPYAKNQSAETVNTPKPSTSATQSSAKNARSDIRQRAIRVGVLLPLHNNDGDGRRMVEYYRGLLMACDSLKQEGISTEIQAWNVPIDADIVQKLTDEVAKCDIVFGPLYTTQVKPLADFCAKHNIRMVIPFSIEGNDVANYPEIFQVYQSPNEIDEAAVDAFFERFPDAHPVIIDCNESSGGKGHFTSLLRQRLETKGIAYNITSLQSAEEDFQKAFSTSLLNVVVLNSGQMSALKAAFTALDKVKEQNHDVEITMFGYKEWLTYFRQNKSHFYTYDVYVPTTFYYNPSLSKTTQLEKTYKAWFKQPMQYVMPKFAITGVDHGMFFLRGLHTYGIDFDGSKAQNSYRHIQTPLRFNHLRGGGYKNDAFMLIHYTNTGKIQAINY